MRQVNEFTAIIIKEGDEFVALCPDLDLTARGATVDEARSGLREAIESLLENVCSPDGRKRLH